MTRLLQMSCLAGLLALVASESGCSGGGGQENNVNENQNQNNQTEARCGDGVRQGAEECDDGAANSDTLPDACRSDCRLPRCGDGVTDGEEECDFGAGNSDTQPNACRRSCLLPSCGDGVIDVGEDCDDGGTLAGDGCGPTCVSEVCGNGSVDHGEVCDDGNTTDGDGCSANCLSEETCGNEVVDLVTGEVCDLGAANSTAPNAACRPTCRPAGCGDGILDDLLGEVCDDGAMNSDSAADSCRTSCAPASCGDGVLDTGEVCDDGNAMGSDGCGAACDRFEYGWNCDPTPPHGCVRCPTYLHGPACDQCAVLVDLMAPGTTRDGSSWASAFHTVQDGIEAAAIRATTLGRICDVWVAEGVYYTHRSGPTDTVRLREGVSVYGGFSGRELTRDERDWRGRPTVLHGGDGLGVDEVYHVVSAEDVTTAVLDGFTITGGNARDPSNEGGGIALVNAPVTLRNLLVAGNRASYGGGLVVSSSSPTITGCRFVDNVVTNLGGGAHVTGSASHPLFEGCLFSGNRATGGAGLSSDYCSITLRRCALAGGRANAGGGLYLNTSSSGARLIESCELLGNVAGSGGGVGSYSDWGVNPPQAPTLISSTVTLNSASSGGGLYGIQVSSGYYSAVVRNSILWGNQAANGADARASSSPSQFVFTYSDVGDVSGFTQPASPNISADPLFVPVSASTGVWTSVSHDAQAFQTTLEVGADTWVPGALVGRFLRPDARDPRYFPIVANTGRSITVWSDVAAALAEPPFSGDPPHDPPFGPGSAFTLFDPRLQPNSPCVDTADAAVAPLLDFLGNPRQDGPDPDFIAQPDMGAYEYQP